MENSGSCTFLKDPLALSDLLESDGTTFEINTNFDEVATNDIFDELNMGSDDESDDKVNLIHHKSLASPWTRPFEELKLQMVKLNEFMFKKIVKPGDVTGGTVPVHARVKIRYNAYWEGEGAPFDSSVLRGSSLTFYTGRYEVLTGLEEAVLTMHRGEESQFIISYELLFLDIGCPPRVKPRSNALFIIELVSFNAIGDVNADESLSEEERNTFKIVIVKVREIHKKALDFYMQRMYRNAIRAFEKEMRLLNFARLSNEQEEKEKDEFLLKLCINLAVCYNKTNSPGKTCIICKEIRNLTKNKPPCKALFQEGRALLMLCDYESSRKVLIAAQEMEPNNIEISKEMMLLEKRYAIYKENEKSIWSRAMGIINETNARANTNKSNNKNKKSSNGDATNVLDDFETEMRSLIQSFKENVNLKQFTLPPGLSSEEVSIIGELAKNMDLKLNLAPMNESSYTLMKD